MNIVDMHCDTISNLHYLNTKDVCLEDGGSAFGNSLYENEGHIDIKKMQKSGYLLQNFALFVEKEKCADPWDEVQTLLALYTEEMKQNSAYIAPVYRYEDIARNREAGKISSLLTVEEGAVCKGEIEKLCQLYQQGVRMMTLTWNYPNELGFPNLNGHDGRRIREEADPIRRAAMIDYYLDTPDEDNGLTGKGLEFISKMEELGMIIDISHLSDAGFYDVLEYTKKPCVASHSNARKVCSCVRNMTNEMIRGLAERGGVMGLNFCSDFLTRLPAGTPNPGTIAAIVEHAKHIVKVGGIEVLGLGSDFDGIDTHAELPHAGKMHLLFDALKKGGFTESQIDKIFSENVLRVYKEVLK